MLSKALQVTLILTSERRWSALGLTHKAFTHFRKHFLGVLKKQRRPPLRREAHRERREVDK